MVMVGRYLAGFYNKQFFRVGFSLWIVNIAVTNGKKKKPQPVIVAAAEIRQIPAELVIPNLIVLRPFVLPFIGAPISKGLQNRR
jgi:hypothetical protein